MFHHSETCNLFFLFQTAVLDQDVAGVTVAYMFGVSQISMLSHDGFVLHEQLMKVSLTYSNLTIYWSTAYLHVLTPF